MKKIKYTQINYFIGAKEIEVIHSSAGFTSVAETENGVTTWNAYRDGEKVGCVKFVN